MEHPIAPMIIRGRVITDDLVLMGGRGGDLSFLAPDPHRYVGQLPLGNPTRLEDLYRLTFDDILDYAGELAQKLDFKTNAHMQRACEISYLTAPSTPSIVKATYLALPQMLERKAIIEATDTTVGIKYLEGWVKQKLIDGTELEIRCFGARTLHIVAGNSPGLVVADDPAQHGHAQRRHHQGAVQRSVHGARDRADHDRHGARPSADQAPERRVLERRRRSVRAAAVPAGAHREDRRLGRLRVDEARDALHPAGAGARLARPETQRQHRRQGDIRLRCGDA